MNVDGWVTIGFRGEDKQLKQDVNSLKNDLKKSEKDIKDMLEAKVKLTMEVGNEEQIKARIKEIKDLMKSGEEFEIEGFEGTGSEYIEYLKEGLSTHQFINNEIDKEKQNYLELENQIKKTEMANEFKKTGKEIGGNIKSIAKLALGIIGIRSAYSMVTRAVSTLSRYNEDMANKIEYIQWAMAKALEPVVNKLLDLGMKLLNVVDLISQALFNYPIFANATADGFNNARKAINGAKKSLAGFDEMTKVSGNGLSDYLGGSIGGDITSDFGQGLIRNKDNILAILSGILGAIVSLKVLGLDPLTGVLGFILGMGIFEFVKGIIDMINDPSWSAFGEILMGLGTTVASITGILMVIGVASGPIGWIVIAVSGLIALIGGLVKVLDQDRDAIKSVEQANRDLNDAKLALNNSEKTYTDAVKREEQAYRDLRKAMDETGINAEELYKKVDDGTLKYSNLNDSQRKVYDAYLNLLIAQGNTKEAEEKLTEAKKEEIKKSLEQELANGKEADSYEKLRDKVVDAYEKGYISADEASKYISRAMSNIDTDSYKTFVENIPDAIKRGLDPFKYMSVMDKLRNWWNGEIEKFRREITLKPTTSDLIISMSPSGYKKTYAKGGIYYPSLPKLAIGGIVNMPGKGINYHGATIGERGAEGVLPLTDSRQMELLGEAIGKYITINATIENSMNGRVISRELARVNQSNDFARNGGYR